MSAKKVLTWVGITVVITWVLASPKDASDVAASAFHGLASAANQLATFVKGLAA